MSIMLAYENLFEELARNETRNVTFKDHPVVPNDSFELVDYYCPDPDCDCQMVMIGVVSKKAHRQIASMVYMFNPKDVEPGKTNPDLDLTPQARFAPALLTWFSAHIKEDPAYLERLKRHYRQVKEAASDPKHPAHQKYLDWRDKLSADDQTDEVQPSKTKKRKKSAEKQPPSVPKLMQARYDEVVAWIAPFCQKHLDDEYWNLCCKLAAALARKRPSPLSGGKAAIWAAGIVHAIAQVNFAFDKSQTPSISYDDIVVEFGVRQATASEKARLIRKLMKIGFMSPEWYVPSKLDKNPVAWCLSIDGFPIDARYAPRAIQEEAFRRGLIPYIPDDQKTK